jgi:hypothetical protein
MTPLDRFFPDARTFLEAHPRRPATLCFTNGCFDLSGPSGTSWWWA